MYSKNVESSHLRFLPLSLYMQRVERESEQTRSFSNSSHQSVFRQTQITLALKDLQKEDSTIFISDSHETPIQSSAFQ